MFWPLVMPYVQKALECGGAEDWSFEAIRQELKGGKKVLWVGHRDGRIVSVTITQIIDWPDRTVLHIYAAGGEKLSDWVDAFDEALFTYMKELQISTAQTYARMGVSKLLKKKSWKPKVTVMEYDIGTI